MVVEKTVVIEVKNLFYSYPESGGEKSRPALRNLSFEIRAGERVALLGANGSGKSTLLGCLNGILPPDQGSVTVRGGVGTVLQNPEDQIIGFTVGEDAAFGPENLGLGEERVNRAVGEALARCGLEGLRDRASQSLSGGEQQRLTLAGVLALDRGILALDEAVSMLDPRGREDFLALLDGLSAEGKTIIQVSHSLEEALRCGRCLTLNRGGLVFDGSPAALLERPELEAWGFTLPEPVRAFRLLRKTFPGFDLSFPAEGVLDVDAAAGRIGEALGKRTAREAINAAAASVPPPAGGPGGPVPAAGHGAALVSFNDASHEYLAGTDRPVAGMRNVSFEVRGSGQVIALIGRSGSGKSTVLKHINALLLPTGGEVLTLGQDTLDRGTNLAALRMGAVLSVQSPESALFERYVADDVAFGPKNAGLSGEELRERVRTAMENAGLPFAEFADREIHSLSGGEKRRAALAGTAAMDSKIVLLDEPLAALDGFHQEKILRLVQELRGGGKTVIISTHSMETAALADQVGIMAGGTMAAFGPPREIFGGRWDPAWGLALPWIAALARRLAPAGLIPAGAVPLNAGELVDCLRGRAPGAGLEMAPPPADAAGNPAAGDQPQKPRRKRRVKPGFAFFTGGAFGPPPRQGRTGRSPALWNMGGGIKLVFLLAAAAAVLAGPPPFFPLGVLILTLGAGWFGGGMSPRRLLRGLVPMAPWLLIFAALQLFYTFPRIDWTRPLFLVLRIAALMAPLSLYSAVTPLGELIRGLDRFFSSLARFGFPARDLSLAVGIALRFAPALAGEAERIVSAQLSRGGRRGRFSMTAALVIPLFLRALERAETLARAMILRGYSNGEKHS
ncbi:MAG: ATP-binding cassette domain-containing protein [Treponema sp.]|jgi:energy-coupling factor transport system ATP-binding protein|nr:ATP-binding cassette domain-containing protein [Treponema sp.]